MVLIIVVNVFINFKYRLLVKEKDVIAEEYSQLLLESTSLKKQSMSQQAAEWMDVSKIELLDMHGNVRNIASIFNNRKPILVYRFRETDCDACVQSTVLMLNRIAEEVPSENIVILCTYKNFRQFSAYQSTQSIRVYNIGDQCLDLDFQDQPYFFVLTRELNARNLFIPLKSDEGLTEDYLKLISIKYWGSHDCIESN